MTMYKYGLISPKGVAGFIYIGQPLNISVLNVELQHKITRSQIVSVESIEDFTDEMGSEEAEFLATKF